MKKNKLLFLAPYPNDRYPKDGMISRISSIDYFFKDKARTYLYVSISKNFKKYYKKDGNLEVVEVNLLKHFFYIIRILRSSSNIYSHSVHFLKNIFFIIIFLNNNYILDAHGVVPEEILYFEKKSFKFYILQLTEKIIFSKYNLTVICVTESMKDHFKEKYPNSHAKYICFGIFPHNLSRCNTDNSCYVNKPKYKSDEIIVIYSGGTAKWQKIDLMTDLIKKHPSDNIKYIILSSEEEEFRKLIREKNIDNRNIIIKSVPPTQLSGYYEIADYGFILRDKNIVNKVANPTKLIEYLYYGIIPIVLTPNIGDYISYQYEYIEFNEFYKDIKKPKAKSDVNMKIAKRLMENNQTLNLSNII